MTKPRPATIALALSFTTALVAAIAPTSTAAIVSAPRDASQPAVTIAAADGAFDLTWHHPDARGYQVRYREVGTGTFTWRARTTATEYTVTGLRNDVAHDVHVRIHDGAWQSWQTTIATPTAGIAEPTVPPTVPTTTTTEPVPTTTEPVPTTTEPAPTTTEPVPTTTEPVPTTTTEPAPTTTEPDSHDDHGTGADGGDWVPASDEHAAFTDPSIETRLFSFDPFMIDDPTWGITRMGFLVDCDSVKFEHVDPIVAPGAVRSAHEHEFFGNPNVTPDSTTQTLADTPTSQIACTNLNDKSGYWAPAVYQDGERQTATKFSMYYKSPTGFEQPVPFGLRVVAGDAAATRNQDSAIGWWESDRGTITSANRDAMIVRGDDSRPLQLRINFPQCWDGLHLDSPDHMSHMAYARDTASIDNHFVGTPLGPDDGNGCPATHPVRIPQLTAFARYDIDGGPGLTLASGEWYTFHMDFWNGWHPDHMARLVDQCGAGDRVMCRIRTSPKLVQLGEQPIWVH